MTLEGWPQRQERMAAMVSWVLEITNASSSSQGQHPI